MAQWAGTRAVRLLGEDMVPVCSPALLNGASAFTAEAIAELPLLQQSTRPDGWREWFDAMGVPAPLARRGPRYELFSMTAAAATCGLGLALVPRLLVEAELARGELVLACAQPLPGDTSHDRAYYCVLPERTENRVLVEAFVGWMRQAVG